MRIERVNSVEVSYRADITAEPAMNYPHIDCARACRGQTFAGQLFTSSQRTTTTVGHDMEKPTKTFQLSEPMDVFMKLEFDVDRLSKARSTKEHQYAALDCATWSYQMIEWVLHAVGDADHLRLTGYKKGHGKSVRGFLDRNIGRLGTLPICQQIANTGKHRILTRTPDDPNVVTSHTILFDPPFFVSKQPYRGDIRAVTYLKLLNTGEEVDAHTFFKASLEQWRNFLKTERLYDWDYNYEPTAEDL